MNRKLRKRLILLVSGVLVIAAVVYGFLPDPARVETVTARRGPMQVLIEEEGETQVRDRYVISAPVAAFARRIDLEVGDFVRRGQEVVRLEPPRSAILDPRTRAEAEARIEAAGAALAQAQESARAAAAVAERAAEERQRVERLYEAGSATQQMREQALAEAAQAAANLQAAQATAAAARAELEAARATLQHEAGGSTLPVQEVLRAPAAGRVLAVQRRSEGMVSPGEPLVEVGDTGTLEVRVDVLSQDAVRIRQGTRVLLDQWGGDATLEGVVERVEPVGFTQVSSLGVEEKRVTVVASLTSPPGLWTGLGAGYRVLARFVVWEGEDVLQVPTSALFRTEDGWAAFGVENGVAVRRPVAVGHQTGLTAQILSGLSEGDLVIAHPDRAIEAGRRVVPRAE